jgi:hypothetical protein
VGESQTIGPFHGGFNSTRARYDLKPDELGPDSLNWGIDPLDGRLVRPGGSTPYGGSDTAGIAESKFGSRCLWTGESRFDSITDGYPTVAAILSDETDKEGLFAWYSSNDSAWHNMGDDFGANNYKISGAGEVMMKIPPLYSDSPSRLWMRHLDATHRKYVIAGTRKYLEAQGMKFFSARFATPICYNGQFNDSTALGTQRPRIFPWGLPPPLFAPDIAVGADLGTTVKGPYKDGDTFYVTVAFEFADGSVGPAFAIRPGVVRSGQVTVGTRQATTGAEHYYDSITLSHIARGPYVPSPCVARRVYVSKIVNLLTSETPYGISEFQLYAAARIANNTSTSLTLFGSDQVSLAADADLRFDHRWPPQAQYAVAVDGRAVVGGAMKQNPLAIIVAPTGAASARQFNVPDDDSVSMFGTISYHVRIDGTNITLKKTTGGVTTKLDIAHSGKTLQQIVDAINATLYTDTEDEWAAQLVPGVDGSMLVTDSITSVVNLAITSANDFGDDTLVADFTSGNARCFGPNYPFYMAFSQAYMALQPVDYYGILMSSAGPSKPDGSFSTFYSRPDNRKGPGSHAVGKLQNIVPITGQGGVVAVIYYERATYLLRNIRGGGTGEDADYRIVPLDEMHGCIAWMTACGGFGLAFAVSDDGMRVTDGGSNPIVISGKLFRQTLIGGVGEWATEIAASLALTGKGLSPYMSASLLGTLLRVRYRTSSGLAQPDRGVDYDFTEGHDIGGLAAVLKQMPDGTRGLYPWGAPRTGQNGSAMGRFANGTGWHNVIAGDANAGTTDGRIDITDDNSYADNGSNYVSDGYSATILAPPFSEVRLQRAEPIWTHAGTAMTVTPYTDPDRIAILTALTLPTTGSSILGRKIFDFEDKARANGQSLEFRIRHDGSNQLAAGFRQMPIELEMVRSVGRAAS